MMVSDLRLDSSTSSFQSWDTDEASIFRKIDIFFVNLIFLFYSFVLLCFSIFFYLKGIIFLIYFSYSKLQGFCLIFLYKEL
jgi:type IV secretory pathway TrbL component